MTDYKNITDFEVPDDLRSRPAEEQIEILKEQVKSMSEQRLDKMQNAKHHLFERLTVMSEQWKTANGVLNALKTMREITETLDYTAEVKMAKIIAKDMADYIESFAAELSCMSHYDFCQSCGNLLEEQGMYNKAFIEREDSICLLDFATELLHLNFCSAIGADLNDCEQFYKASEEEIDKVKGQIKELEADEKTSSAAHKADKE